MLDSRTLQILITAKNEASKTISSVSSSLKKAEGQSRAFGIGLLAIGTGAVVAGTKAVKAFNEQQTAEKRLAQISTQVSGATKEQIKGFIGQADALQKVGVMGNDVIIAGQSQLASFTKNADVISILTESMADLSVATYGTKVSQEQAIQTSNMMGRALSGQLGALTRTGILVSGKYKKAFEEANTTQERAIVIAKIVKDNYGGVNKALRNTAEGGIIALKNNFGDFQKMVGAKIVPILNVLVGALNNFVQNTLPPLLDKVSSVINFLEDHKVVIYIIVGMIVGALVPAIVGLAISIKTAVASAVVSLAPFMIGGAVIAGIIYGIVWVVKNWQKIKDKATEIFGKIKEYIVNVWNIVSGETKNIWNGIKNFFSNIWDGVKNVFTFALDFIKGIFIATFDILGINIVEVINNIKSRIGEFWDNIKTNFSSALDFIENLWNKVWNGMKNFIITLWQGIKKTLSSGWNWITQIFKKFTKPLSDGWTAVWNIMGDKVKSVWEGVKNTIKSGLNWVLKKINSLIRSANTVAQIGAGIGIRPPSIPTIPLLAKGGIITRPTLAMVGEAGAEAVVPLSNRRFGTTINISISGNTISDDLDIKDIAEKVSLEVARVLGVNQKLSY